MPRKPTPKVVSEVCSLCGLDWTLHGENPTTETCIELLLGEVRSLNAWLAHRPLPQPLPIPWYPQPIPLPWGQRPWVYPRPMWSTTGGGSNQSTYGGHRPLTSNTVPRALSA